MTWIAAAALLLLQDEPTSAMERVLRALREKVAPAVVAIDVVRTADPDGKTGSGPSGAHVDYYNRPAGPTSGTILEAGGYILTSWFNVSGDVKKISVTLGDGRRLEAKRLGYDETHDVALLKVEAEGLPVLPLAKEEELRQGDFVAIVGRSPDPETPTLNAGILSATSRMKGTAVQTDAELNYGNVGGALVTLKGELVGVCSHIRPRQPWGQSSGVGFATKTGAIGKILEDLKKGRTSDKRKTPWLGILFAPEAADGVKVTQVVPNSPAEEAGIEEGDIIVSFGGKALKSGDELRAAIEAGKPGDEVALEVRRVVKGKEQLKKLQAKLELNPN